MWESFKNWPRQPNEAKNVLGREGLFKIGKANQSFNPSINPNTKLQHFE
jgi:hypothetical protein